MNIDELIEEGDVDRLIAAALRDENCWVCLRAAKALGRIGDPRAVEPLITVLGDEEPYVRWSVADALGMIGDLRAVEPLITALGNADWKVRGNAAKALGRIGDPRAVEPLITVLGDEEPYVRERAVNSLGRVGDPRAVEPLIVALQDEDSDVRRLAAEALGMIGDPRAVSALEKAIYNSDKIFGDEAKKALGKIKSSDAYKEFLKSFAIIFSIESEIKELKSAGVGLHDAEEFLRQAKAKLNKNNFEEATESANKAKGVAYEKKAVYDLAFRSISEAEAILAEIRTRGVTIPDEPLTQARHAFDQGNYEEAIGCAKQSEENAKRIQEENKPKITLKFPEETFKPNIWKRIEITITNTGSMHAKKIKIEPSSDIEFRRIPTISQLDENETKTMTIGMKPAVMGDVPIDVAITFTDALDREYTSSEEMWLLIAESTPMSEPISTNEFSPRQGQSEYRYQVALSFAGEDRKYAKGLAELLKEKDLSVFYDMYEQADLWGKDNYQHFQLIYRDKAQFCVVFLSHAYAQKLWTRHELESAQARAFRENKEYILPVKIDDTEIPGINETIGYIDLRLVSLEEIANMLVKKLSSQNLED